MRAMAGICAAVAMCVAGVAVNVATAVEGVEAEGARGAAFTFAKKLITPVLNNPSSADFNWESVKVRLNKRLRLEADADLTQIVAVEGVVRGTNAFNAVVPQNYLVYMSHSGDTWQPILVMLGDSAVYQTEDGAALLRLTRKQADENREKAMKQLEEEGRERARVEKEKREQAMRLREARQAGNDAFAAAAKRNRWNQAQNITHSNAMKAATKAASESDYGQDDAEREEFIAGFMARIAKPVNAK
jgi:hypothetical protein